MRKVFLLIIAAVVLAVIYGVYHDRRIDQQLPAVDKQAEASVRRMLGSPSTVGNSCAAYGTAITTGDCDHVLVYKSFFNALHPQYWLVFIDKEGQATATARQNEP